MDISLSYDHFSEYEPVPQSCKRPRSRTARSERNPTEFDLICRKRRLRELMPPVRVRKDAAGRPLPSGKQDSSSEYDDEEEESDTDTVSTSEAQCCLDKKPPPCERIFYPPPFMDKICSPMRWAHVTLSEQPRQPPAIETKQTGRKQREKEKKAKKEKKSKAKKKGKRQPSPAEEAYDDEKPPRRDGHFCLAEDESRRPRSSCPGLCITYPGASPKEVPKVPPCPPCKTRSRRPAQPVVFAQTFAPEPCRARCPPKPPRPPFPCEGISPEKHWHHVQPFRRLKTPRENMLPSRQPEIPVVEKPPHVKGRLMPWEDNRSVTTEICTQDFALPPWAGYPWLGQKSHMRVINKRHILPEDQWAPPRGEQWVRPVGCEQFVPPFNEQFIQPLGDTWVQNCNWAPPAICARKQGACRQLLPSWCPKRYEKSEEYSDEDYDYEDYDYEDYDDEDYDEEDDYDEEEEEEEREERRRSRSRSRSSRSTRSGRR